MEEQLQSPKKRRYKKKDLGIAYSIPLSFGLVLEAKESANAWWMDSQKVQNIIASFRIGLSIPHACAYVGITLRQYKYFVKLHPVFKEARRGFILEPDIKARMTLINALSKGNIKVSWQWLEMYDPEFARTPKNPQPQEPPRQLPTQQRQESEAMISPEELDALKRLKAIRAKQEREARQNP